MAARRPLVFVGRHRFPVPAEAARADDWGTAPGHLLPLLNQTSVLVLADPLAFPYEVMRPVDRDIPVAVVLPPLPPEDLDLLLGGPLLDHLGPGDRVAAGAETWETLAGPRRWPPAMRLRSAPEEMAAAMEESLLPGTVGPRSAKEEGRRRAGALAHLLAGLPESRDGVIEVLDLDGKAGLWRHLLPGGLEPASAPAAAPLTAPDESVSAAAALGVLGGLAPEDRSALAAEMWRVVVPGGRLAVVDDVVPIPGSGRACPFEREGLPRLLREASGGRVAPGRVRAIRFPGEPLHRGMGISVVKVGDAREW